MEKRLFVGVPVIVDRSLESALKKTRINAQKREMEFDWTPSANFHVTLSFIGATPIDRIPLLEDVLTRVAERNPITKTSLSGMGAFPDEHHMRVLWVGVRKSRGLMRLNEDLCEALSNEGFPQDERAFVPHLTIGRLRKSRSGKDLLSPFVRTNFGDISIDEIILYESQMHSGRPRYEALKRFKLNPDLSNSADRENHEEQ